MADRYLLENSAVDGYQLEDGSGVLLNEQHVEPQASMPLPPSTTMRLIQAGY